MGLFRLSLKLVSIQRGHDPRDFVLVAAGGGGAMHAAALGRELGVKEIIVPRYPGYFSAWGMLATEPRCDFATCLSMKLSKAAETQRMSHRGFQSLCHIRVRTVQLPPTSL